MIHPVSIRPFVLLPLRLLARRLLLWRLACSFLLLLLAFEQKVQIVSIRSLRLWLRLSLCLCLCLSLLPSLGSDGFIQVLKPRVPFYLGFELSVELRILFQRSIQLKRGLARLVDPLHFTLGSLWLGCFQDLGAARQKLSELLLL